MNLSLVHKNHQLFDNKFDERYDTKNSYEKLLPELEKNVQNVLSALKSELSYVIPAYAKKLEKKRSK